MRFTSHFPLETNLISQHKGEWSQRPWQTIMQLAADKNRQTLGCLKPKGVSQTKYYLFQFIETILYTFICAKANNLISLKSYIFFYRKVSVNYFAHMIGMLSNEDRISINYINSLL